MYKNIINVDGKKILINYYITLFLHLILLIFFSDLSSANLNIKLVLFNFFYLSNFFVDFTIFNKFNFFTNNLFSHLVIISLFYNLILIKKIFSFRYILNFKQFIYTIYIFSLILFIYNLLNGQTNLLPFDKIWLIFFLKNIKINIIILLNYIFFFITQLRILNLYSEKYFLIFFIIFLLILFFLYFIKYKILIKNFNYIFFLVTFFIFVSIIFSNKISKNLILYSSNINFHSIISSKFLNENHFLKTEYNKDVFNKSYFDQCQKNKCKNKKISLIYGDTQIQQYTNLILSENKDSIFLINFNKFCFFSKDLIFSNPTRLIFYKKFNYNCRNEFIDLERNINLIKNNNNKINVYVSSWYNWYIDNKIILDKDNNIIGSNLAYLKLNENLENLLKNSPKNIRFYFFLPPPQFDRHPRSCSIKKENCFIPKKKYEKQIIKLQIIYKNLENKYSNFRLIEPKKFLCDNNKCSMIDPFSKLILYRDKENFSKNSIIFLKKHLKIN